MILPDVKRVYVFCHSFNLQPTFEEFNKIMELGVHELEVFPIITDEHIRKILILQSKERKPTLIILDDQTGIAALNVRGKGHFAQMCCNSVWLDLSIVVVCHRIRSVDLNFRENVDDVINFHSHRKDELTILNNEFYSDFNKNHLENILFEKVKEHNFLYRHMHGKMECYLNFKEPVAPFGECMLDTMMKQQELLSNQEGTGNVPM